MNNVITLSVLLGIFFIAGLVNADVPAAKPTQAVPTTPVAPAVAPVAPAPTAPVAQPATSPPCIEFVSNTAYDTAGNRILRFMNKCNQGLYLSVCLKTSTGAFVNLAMWVAPNQTFDLHVEPNLPDQTFNFAWDPTNPSMAAPCAMNTLQAPAK